MLVKSHERLKILRILVTYTFERHSQTHANTDVPFLCIESQPFESSTDILFYDKELACHEAISN